MVLRIGRTRRTEVGGEDGTGADAADCRCRAETVSTAAAPSPLSCEALTPRLRNSIPGICESTRARVAFLADIEHPGP